MELSIISSESEIRTEEVIEPFVTIAPPGYGRDSGVAWLALKIVTKQTVIPNDGFGRTIFQGEPDVSVWGRRLTKKGTATGAVHLLWWFHDRDDIYSAVNVSEHVARRVQEAGR